MSTTVRSTSSGMSTVMLLAAAGVLFAVYPALRPYTDETTLVGAEAMASTAWGLAHAAAMIGFILLPLALLGVRAGLADTQGAAAAGAAYRTAWVGAGFVLPYYGGETFGLKAISDAALSGQDTELLTLAETVRLDWLPGTFFAVGMLLLAAAGVLTARAVARSGVMPGWAGIPLAAGLVLFIPQFFGPAAGRIGHGLLMAAGCLILAWAYFRRAGGQPTAS
ncbi:hypothetical protein ABZ863_19130 [Saccharomonospora sp. NPDC046836]|uniref:hypothetical protein n=1 Tax=Saccharomonospora sp. NPDC046836 TaxID=3156921 RepID=UPI003400F68F